MAHAEGQDRGYSGRADLEFLRKYFGNDIDIREYKSTEQHHLDLAAGGIDALFTQGTALAATLSRPEFADYTMAGPGFLGELLGHGIGAGVRKDDTVLRDMLNKAINEAVADDTNQRLSMQRLHTDVTPSN
ncbi:MAG: hypothetical protein ACOH2H_06290 [Cypionkella sp.]